MNMPPTPPAAPATMPRKRRAFDLTKLPPEMQSQLAAGQPITFDDGSTVYPDGTAEGAGDSPDDFTMGPATAPPGMSGGKGMGGMHPMPDGGMMPNAEMGMGMMEEEPLPAPPTNVFEGPQFERHFATRNAPFAGAEDEGDNPMEEALPDPFETPEPARSVRTPSNDDPIGTGRAMPRKSGSATKRSPMGVRGRMRGRLGNAPATSPRPRGR
jgi:hypothetical protein